MRLRKLKHKSVRYRLEQMKFMRYKWYIALILVAVTFGSYIAIAGPDTLGLAGGRRDSCTDTDGGNAPTVFGKVSGLYKNRAYSYSDACVNSGTIKEYYCSGKYQANVQQSCGTDGYTGSNYCMGGNVYRDFRDYSCLNGSCKSATAPTIQQVCDYGCANSVCNLAPQNTCTDLDGGIVLTINGATYGQANGVPYSHNDTCADASNVNEHYCSGTAEIVQAFNCGTGGYESPAYCMGPSIYRDYTTYNCNSGACRSSTSPILQQTCTSGCLNGTCISAPQNTCYDTDGGLNYGFQGTVSGYKIGLPYTYADFCNSNNQLIEWYCSGTAPYAAPNYTCTGNYTACLNGACI